MYDVDEIDEASEARTGGKDETRGSWIRKLTTGIADGIAICVTPP